MSGKLRLLNHFSEIRTEPPARPALPEKHRPTSSFNSAPSDDPIPADVNSMFEFSPRREYSSIIVNEELTPAELPFINSYFDNIYAINLPHRRTRRLGLIQQLRRMKIRAEIFEAEDGYLPQHVEDFKRYFEEPIGGPGAHPLEIRYKCKNIKTPGAWGTLITYRRVLEDAQRKGYRRILCLEDDVIFHIDFHGAFERWARTLDQDWRMLHLGASQHSWDHIRDLPAQPSADPTAVAKSYVPSKTDGSFAIAFDSRVFQELIAEMAKMNSTVDSGPYRDVASRHRGKCFVAYPNLAIADVRSSDTGIPRDQEEFAAKFRWNLSLYDFPPVMDLASVIMPAYNAAATIEASINSILNQTYPEIELIVTDDGSTDRTSEIVQRIARRDHRVRLIRHKSNRGCYAARNSALRASQGKFIAIQDTDDISFRTRLERQILPIALGRAEVSLTRMFRSRCTIDELYGLRDEEIARLVLSRRKEGDPRGEFAYSDRPNLGLVTSVFARSVFEDLGLFWEHSFGADAEILERLIFARTGKVLSETDKTAHAFITANQFIPGVVERVDSVQLISVAMNKHNVTNQYSPENLKQFISNWRNRFRGIYEYIYPTFDAIAPQSIEHAKTRRSAAHAGRAAPSSARSKHSPRQPSITEAKKINDKLWGGFERYALPELESLKLNPTAPALERGAAASYLSQWYFREGQLERALENIEHARTFEPKLKSNTALAHAQILLELERPVEASKVLDCAKQSFKLPDIMLMQSTAARMRLRQNGLPEAIAEHAQLDIVNQILSSADLGRIAKRVDRNPLSLSNILARAPAPQSDQSLKVSVIMPVFNAASTIEWALRSVLEQTWRNLEIIAVDDCSTDGSPEVISRMSAVDSRVRLVRSERNGGAYCARNIGARLAQGDLLTVQDSDDWSHPQKIERHVSVLLNNPKVTACMSQWLRVNDRMEFVGDWMLNGNLCERNFSSLMFQRTLLDKIGFWDEVRIGADSEFFLRIQAVYGAGAVVHLPRDQPLSFSLSRENSLTRTAATHLTSLYNGVRRDYRYSYGVWHKRLAEDKEQLPFDPSPDRRPFPIPASVRPERHSVFHCDTVIVADFTRDDTYIDTTLDCILRALQSGQSVAIYQWYPYNQRVTAELNSKVYDACIRYKIDILCARDTVKTKSVVVCGTEILSHVIDPRPTFHAQEVIVVVDQFDSQANSSDEMDCNQKTARSTIKEVFGTEGFWVSSFQASRESELEQYLAEHTP